MSDPALEKKQSSGSSRDGAPTQHHEKRRDVTDIDPSRDKLAAVFENPLAGVPDDKLMQDVEEFCAQHNLMEYIEDMKKGARVAKAPHEVQTADYLSEQDKEAILREKTHKWDHPWMLYWLCGEFCTLLRLVRICSCADSTQSCARSLPLPRAWTKLRTTELFQFIPRFVFSFCCALSVLLTNGKILGITPEKLGSQTRVNNIQGLVVSAPYLACAVLGCWLTEPLNRVFARRGTIFISCLIAAVASIWEAVVQSWPNLFVARFVLGLGIGAKSSTTPVYAAECAPAAIRGALVMQWQVWTAFGIMVCREQIRGGQLFDHIGTHYSAEMSLLLTSILSLAISWAWPLEVWNPTWLGDSFWDQPSSSHLSCALRSSSARNRRVG